MENIKEMKLEDIIAIQTTTRGSNYTTYDSKKKLLAANVLTPEQTKVMEQLKNTFLFNLHNDKKYMVITMYYSRDKETKFYVYNMHTHTFAELPSVKIAKQYVAELIKKDCETVVEDVENTDTTETTPENPVEDVVVETVTEEPVVEEVVVVVENTDTTPVVNNNKSRKNGRK